MTDARWVFVSWIHFHGRSNDLAFQLRARAEYITGGGGNRIGRYFRQWRETVRLMKRTDPDVVFVMQPPVLALWAVRAAVPKDAFVVGDLHTGVFTDPKWSWAARATLRALRRRNGAAIVTNESLAGRCRSAGVETYVLDDAVPRRVGSAPVVTEADELKILEPNTYVLVPLAYAADEPIDEILAAAENDSRRTWVLTGRAPVAVQRRAAHNVRFTGFVSNDDYNWLAANAGAIVACTSEEDTMQRAGYEAVSWERPLVTSKTRALIDYFEDAALFAEPTSKALVAGVNTAFERREALIRRMADLGKQKRAEYDAAIQELRGSISRSAASSA